jgi:PhzF family phenazine biosynthesis protein
MLRRPFLEIDVFTALAYRGNALAVVLEAAGLETERMQLFARWTNLSETCFLLPPTDPAADYQVRIFTPTSELPFAGHPSLGSCHAWLERGGAPRHPDRITQQCPLGLVQLRRDGAGLAFCAPPMAQKAVPAALLESVLAALGLPRAAVRAAQWLHNGPNWLGLLVDSAATLLALEPDHAQLKSLANVGLIGPYGRSGTAPGPAVADFEVRAFVDIENIPEDPVTGSLNAALGQWLIPQGLLPPRYLVSQGTRLQRAGRVTVMAQDGQIWVSGESVTCVEGTVLL